jgi:uncharacterized protein (DUF433 family)
LITPSDCPTVTGRRVKNKINNERLSIDDLSAQIDYLDKSVQEVIGAGRLLAGRGVQSYVGKRGGKQCIRGLRIAVYDILEYLASGMSEDEILRDFPDLTREDIRASLAFAADRERKLTTIPA